MFGSRLGGYAGGGKARIKRACIGLTLLVLEWQECQAFKFKGRREHSQKLNNLHHQSEDNPVEGGWVYSAQGLGGRFLAFNFRVFEVDEQAGILNHRCDFLFAFTDDEEVGLQRKN